MLKSTIPILPSANKLSRPLIPFFRNRAYGLSKWPEYKNHLIQIINKMINETQAI